MRRRMSADGDDFLALEVAAAFRVDLVFDVAAGDAQVLEDVDGAGGAQRLAEPGVGVDERGQPGGAGDLVAAGGHLGQRRQADVGQGQRGGHDGAGDVDPFEAEAFDQQWPTGG